ncbi:HSF-type DNA-binding-domain-containing protein [Choanephora cucurbitarum]|nr:HSF-type DNA-binding-domain-containing protein [Choanephora cucurbitarum]
MNNGHANPIASLGINTQFSGNSPSNGGGSPLNSPLISPAAGSPSSFHALENNWDQLQNQFSQQMSLQPPSSTSSQSNSTKPGSGNTFVHKLYNMVVDKQYQHLIAWTYTGTSFVVCNITDFSKDVLPKHFKHNNFSSFVRQLNMYGFHKVNKSPRGHRTLAENQIWEFSHAKFLRNRPDLLDEIKRKALESDSVRRDTSDMSSHMAMMQMSQSDMMQQISHLQDNLNQMMNELAETKKRQAMQEQMMRSVMDFMNKHHGTSLHADLFDLSKQDPDRPPPPIYITSADNQQQQQQNQFFLNVNEQPSVPNSPLSTASSPRMMNTPPLQLTVQTQNLHVQRSPSLTPTTFQMAVGSPLPPSPCSTSPGQFLGEDDNSSQFYSPRSPIGSTHGYLLDPHSQPF